ncbi:MarR family transcriptional regulator [Mycobacterium sp. 1274756.6]|uniref:MarR family winged helix-turn-helix transcriptional regulator n=1 Tax=Mycobacterium sp. 1274756.6 TaxID=1834076 RepID=UPI000801186D|nr:MarR family transcriptional regulator [Mycobacterium sp. 1274756.6]OBJ70290.1 MarR family transcriptional regulator [Mycobacterium sp. 1274756.6]
MDRLDDAPLGYLLHRVSNLLRPEATAALRPLDLSLTEFVCLRILSLYPGTSSAELARHTNVTPQAMNTVLRRLEDAGAVSRPASVPSGRALPASLTRSGAELLTRAERAVRTADATVLSRLSAAEQREFKRMLTALGSDEPAQP